MSENVKTKIHRFLDTITDDAVLQMVAEDIQYYTGSKDIIDELTDTQQEELNGAISEADNNTITWDDFKKDMDEWEKR